MGAYVFVILLLIVFDQFFKIWAYNLTGTGPFNLIPKIFYINYVENRGAAFNLLEGHRWLLVGFTAVVLAIFLYVIFAKKITNDTIVSGLMLITSGGLSNLIDRGLRGFVIDYLDLSFFFNFPVFNLADVFVVLGTAMILYYVFVQEPRQKKAATLRIEKGAE